MKDITVIIPLLEVNNEIFEYLDRAVKSVAINQEFYENRLKIVFVCPDDKTSKAISKHYPVLTFDVVINNSEKTDFCSQINYAVNNIVDTDYFSILEFDDVYTNKWFKSAKEYYYTNEDVSVFLPINVEINDIDGYHQYCNEMVWANGFTEVSGFIDSNYLADYYGINLTGAVFNTKDFIAIGGYNSNIKVAFNYDYLLRLINKGLKAYVVPKEGYCHLIYRNGSLSKEYYDTLTNDEIVEQFNEVKKENNIK